MRGIVQGLLCVGSCVLVCQLSACAPSMVDIQFVTRLEALLGTQGRPLMTHIKNSRKPLIPEIRKALSVDPFTLKTGIAAALKNVQSENGDNLMATDSVYRASIGKLEVSNTNDNVSFIPYPTTMTVQEKKLVTMLAYNYFVSQRSENVDSLLYFFPCMSDIDWNRLDYGKCATASDIVSQYILHIAYLQGNPSRYPSGINQRQKFLAHNLFLSEVGNLTAEQYSSHFTHPTDGSVYVYLNMCILDYPGYKDLFLKLSEPRLKHLGDLCVQKHAQTPSQVFNLIMKEVVSITNLDFDSVDREHLRGMRTLYDAQMAANATNSNFSLSSTATSIPTSQLPNSVSASSIPTKVPIEDMTNNATQNVNTPSSTTSQENSYPSLPPYSANPDSFNASASNFPTPNANGPQLNSMGIPMEAPPKYSPEDELHRNLFVEPTSNSPQNLATSTSQFIPPNVQNNISDNAAAYSSANNNLNADSGGLHVNMPGLSVYIPSAGGSTSMGTGNSSSSRFDVHLPGIDATNDIGNNLRIPTFDTTPHMNQMFNDINMGFRDAFDSHNPIGQTRTQFQGPVTISSGVNVSNNRTGSNYSSRRHSPSSSSSRSSHSRSSHSTNPYRTKYGGVRRRTVSSTSFADTILFIIMFLTAVIFFSVCGSVHAFLQREKKNKISKGNLRSTSTSGRSAHSNSAYFQLLVA